MWGALLLGMLLLAPTLRLGAADEGAGGATTPTAERPSAAILMYHRFGEDRYPATSIRLAEFEAQLRELAGGGYRVLPVRQIVEALRAGTPLPPRSVGITMDDAYRSLYREAWPRLKAAGFPFTVFVATDPLDGRYPDMLTWAELREMVRSGGVDIGNHTASHLHMADHDEARDRREVEQSARRILAETGVAPVLFAYPYGEHSPAARAAAALPGVRAAFGQQSGVAGPHADLMALPRFALNESYGELSRFRLVIDALPLPVRELSPPDGLLSAEHNPPRVTFLVDGEAGALRELHCYLTGQGELPVAAAAGRLVTVSVAKALTPGRWRINCTLPAGAGRWRWFGLQYYVRSPTTR